MRSVNTNTTQNRCSSDIITRVAYVETLKRITLCYVCSLYLYGAVCEL